MTVEDVMDFCEKGNHKYREVDVLRSVKALSTISETDIYILFQCDICPSKWVKKI